VEQPPLKTHWYTDRGRRPSNEDAVIVEALFGDRDLVAVADGMGGHAGGEVASAKALETLLTCLESSNDLAAAIREANVALQRASEANPDWRGMGTTLVALLRVGEAYYVANVGDSRAYRIDADGIRRITEDHSFTAEAVSSGRLSEDEAERSPWRNALTRAVGTDAEVEVDVFGPFPLEPPHVVVLCTDGLYRVMSDEELGSEVLSGRERVDGARDLVANALRRGSSDNISVALVEFGDVAALESVDGTAGAVAVAGPLPVSAEVVPTLEADDEVDVREGAAEPLEAGTEPLGTDREAGATGEDEPDPGPVEGPRPSLEEPVPVPPEESAAAGSGGLEAQAAPEETGAEAQAPIEETAPAQALTEDVPPRQAPREDAATVEARAAEAAATAQAPPDKTATAEALAEEAPAEQAAIESAHVTSSYRKAKPARPRRHRRPPRQPRKLPSWVKREAVPAVILVLGTLAVVWVLTSVFG
jgi:protein phosphatase